MFERLCLIGIGLIGSSIAHVARREGLAGEIVGVARSDATRAKALELGLVDRIETDPGEAVEDADFVVLCAPVGANAALGQAIGSRLMPGAIVSDVGSVKVAVIRDLAPHIPKGVHLVPAHPVAGTEYSGPQAGFAELFEERWCILTPPPGANETAVETVAAFWRRAGAKIELMDAAHHDVILAITSHLPHLIAYNIVDTVADLEATTKAEVFKYAAGGFRDFTRIAASDPVMWRDIFMNNREAVLEMLGRFTEDLTALQRAIRRGDAELLEEVFTRTRAIRKGVIKAGQA